MDRREFLRGATQTLLVLPFGTFLVHCGGDDDNTVAIVPTQPTQPSVDTTPPDAPPRVDGANIEYTSDQVDLHSHSFSIPAASLTSPPAAGVSGATTSAQFHQHFVAVSEAQLRAAADGQVVKVQTTSVAGHTHTFTFVRVATPTGGY